jgi:hypothetical protein
MQSRSENERSDLAPRSLDATDARVEQRSVVPDRRASDTREGVMANLDDEQDCSVCSKAIEPTDSLGMSGDKIMHMICYVRYMAEKREQREFR